MNTLGVSPRKYTQLVFLMEQLNVNERDFEETFVRSSGPGGQNVNKVSTCVHLVHRPTGLSVKHQKERSQTLNRYMARWLLLKKIQEEQEESALDAAQSYELKRRQNRKRSQMLKETILQKKHYHSEKKKNRAKVKIDKTDLE